MATQGRSLLQIVVACGFLVSPALSQVFVPAKSVQDPEEGNSRTNYPLMRDESRSQYLIAASEIGSGPMSFTQLSFRYDAGAFGPNGGTLSNFEIYLANSTVSPGASSPYFASNLSSPLTKVYSKASFVFGADSGVLPHAWGGPNGEFTFVFSAPFAYTGGSLVLEIRADGNTNTGPNIADCMWDLEEEPLVGLGTGTATAHGTGCHGAVLNVSGQLAVGGQIAYHGAGLGANSMLIALIGVSRTLSGQLPLPLHLGIIGAPNCYIYNDSFVTLQSQADAQGIAAAYDPKMTVGVPINTALTGSVLQCQLAMVRPGVNQLGLTTSNNVEVKIGGFTALKRGYMGYFHHKDRNASVAAMSAPAIPIMLFK